jgi:tRNA-specific 2-thiouridylase
MQAPVNLKGKKVAVAMSGGVDSTVAAALLQEEGYEVIGLWMQVLGDGPPEEIPSFRDAQSSAESIGVSLFPVDLRESFQKEVIDYFLQEYLAGRTPNPCVICNPRIKFGPLMERGIELGAESFATGHYARIRWDSAKKLFCLLKGIDMEKDQSYFLWGLSQEQLARCLFPNGDFTKEKVREEAKKRGLPATERAESQEICFIPDGDYRDFLHKGLQGDIATGGEIVNKAGQVLGQHEGIFGFTIGQRRGIGIPSSRPYYVLRIDPPTNQVIVGHKEDLLAGGLKAYGMHWVSIPPPKKEFRALGKIRYRHAGAACQVIPRGEAEVVVQFDEPQEAITPGQGLVLYEDDCLLGGGWIGEVSDG